MPSTLITATGLGRLVAAGVAKLLRRLARPVFAPP